MGQFDLKRFRQDLKETRSDREHGRPGRPASTGAMAVVRENLDVFDRLRAEDETLTWGDIAISLGRQGVMQRDGKPMTAKRLSALISTIRKQRTAKEQAAARRTMRSDVAARKHHSEASPEAVEPRLTLAPEMKQAAPVPPKDDHLEKTIRDERYAQHDKLFKQKG